VEIAVHRRSRTPAIRIAGAEEQVRRRFVITGNLFEDRQGVTISRWGTSSRAIGAYEPDQVADLGDGERLTVAENGAFRLWDAARKFRAAAAAGLPRPRDRPNSRSRTTASCCSIRTTGRAWPRPFSTR
jgi:hypothetical protein